MYLQAHPTNDPRPCRDAPGFGTGTDRPGYFEIGLLHEILHVIGFSPPCAPHASASAFPDHVNDSPTDLMYGPDATHHRVLELVERRSRLQPRRLLPGERARVSRSLEQPLPGGPAVRLGHGERPRHRDEQPRRNRLSRQLHRHVPTRGHAHGDAVAGATFRGWTGACSGTATCVVTRRGIGGRVFQRLVASTHAHAARSRAACDGRARRRRRLRAVPRACPGDRRTPWKAGLVDPPQGANRPRRPLHRFDSLGSCDLPGARAGDDRKRREMREDGFTHRCERRLKHEKGKPS